MSGFIPGNTMTENVRALAWSALPDAPVEPDDTRPPGLIGRTLRRLLRWRPVNMAILAEADRKNMAILAEADRKIRPSWRMPIRKMSDREVAGMLVLTGAQVEALLELDPLIDALASAMADLSAGRASAPDRVAALVPDEDGLLAAMPGFVPSAGVLMSKLVSLFPRNADTGLPTHQAVIVAFDPHTGQPAALLDGTALTAIRTGACSALSARLLARPEAAVLAVLGTGVQARSHARAMCRVRPIREIRIAGRDPAKAAALAAELSGTLPATVHTAQSYQDAQIGADIVCATTHAVEPVVRRAWLSPGVHVTSVGYNQAGREVDDATVADALVCVESVRTALAPFPAGSNDLLIPIRDGVITAEHVHTELGELVAGSKPGRTSPEQITLYKSVGVAVQDAVAAALAMTAARERGIGQEINL